MIKSQNEIKKISNNLYNEKKSKEIELENLKLNLDYLSNAVNAYKLNTEIAEKTYTMTEKLYEAGRNNYLELKEAEKNRFNAKLNLYNAEYDYISSVFDLEYLINKEILR